MPFLNPPLPLPRPGRLIPFALQKAVLERALAMAFRDQIAEGRLDFLEGRWLHVAIEDAGLEWFITRDAYGLSVKGGGVKPDISFRGKLREFVLLASRRVDPDTLFFQRRLTITGDTELGLACKNLMDTVEWDRWPRLARRLLQTVGAMVSFARD